VGVTFLVTRRYEIRIRGSVTPDDLAELGLGDAGTEPVSTVLRGEVPDQAALHGILDRLQSLGLEVVEVRRLPEAAAP
jgi:hypothetical protein